MCLKDSTVGIKFISSQLVNMAVGAGTTDKLSLS